MTIFKIFSSLIPIIIYKTIPLSYSLLLKIFPRSWSSSSFFSAFYPRLFQDLWSSSSKPFPSLLITILKNFPLDSRHLYEIFNFPHPLQNICIFSLLNLQWDSALVSYVSSSRLSLWSSLTSQTLFSLLFLIIFRGYLDLLFIKPLILEIPRNYLSFLPIINKIFAFDPQDLS